jgi:hypothetical protein
VRRCRRPTASLVADSALYNAETLPQLADTGSQWITRIPATWSDAPGALAEADPETMEPRLEGYRPHVRASSYGGVAPRWVLIDSEHRRPQAQRTVEKPRLTQRAAKVKAFRPLGRPAFACEADAPQALATWAQGWQATRLHEGTRRPTCRSAQPGRPGKVTVPEAPVYSSEGALTASLAVRDALVAQHRCCMLATNELDEWALSPQELLAG